MTLWRGEEDQHTTHQPEIKVTPKKEIAGKKNPPHSIQQGLEIRSFWFKEKTVQLKTALHEVYTYVLKGNSTEC